MSDPSLTAAEAEQSRQVVYNRPHCSMCGMEIPQERLLLGCGECSPVCRRRKRDFYRKLRNSRICKYCGRPKPQARAVNAGNQVPTA